MTLIADADGEGGRDECRDAGEGDVRGASLLTLPNDIAPVQSGRLSGGRRTEEWFVRSPTHAWPPKCLFFNGKGDRPRAKQFNLQKARNILVHKVKQENIPKGKF